MNKYLEISRFTFIIGIILLPIIVSPFSETPYTLIKTLFLSLTILLSTILFFLSKPNNIKLPNLAINLFFAYEIAQGFVFDNSLLFPRYSEHYTISILLYIFVFLLINLYENINIEKIIFYSSFLVVPVSMADVFILNSRSLGTFGQANFLSIFLIISLLIFIKNFNEFKKIYAVYLIPFLIILIVKTASITSLIALIIGLFYLRKNLSLINKKVFFYFTAFATLVLLFFGDVYISKIKDVSNQIFNPTQTEISDSFLIRLQIWNLSLEIIQQNIISLFLGYGSNNFEITFESQRKNLLENYSEKNLLFDKPHNYYLEILHNKGVIGLFLFVFLIYKALIKSQEYRFLLLPLLFFLLFNWLDIYFKVILFALLTIGIKDFYIVNFSKKIIGFLITAVSILIFMLFGKLFYKDSKSFFGSNIYVYSIDKNQLLELNYKNPVFLISSLKYLNNEESKLILNFLKINFPDNRAILFQTNKLF